MAVNFGGVFFLGYIIQCILGETTDLRDLVV
jgi:hypothetical protein